MYEYFATGILLGLSAGLAPGPLLTLVIAETLRAGTRAGIRVALAPLITDLPIVWLCLALLGQLQSRELVMGAIALLGAGFLMRMGWENLRLGAGEIWIDHGRSGSLRKGILVNLFSPYPYLFWLSVGGPLVIEGAQTGLTQPLAFLAAFYVCLVGAKILLAVLTGRTANLFSSPLYLWSLRALGILLLGWALGLFWEALLWLGII